MTAQKVASSSNESAQPSKVWAAIVWLLQFAFWVLSLGAGIMALVNVFGSGIEVDALATKLACQGQPAGCEAVTMQWERTPLAHTMQVSTTGGTKIVRCQREYILYGTWGCASSDKILPALPPHLAASATRPYERTIIIQIPASAQVAPAKQEPSATPRAAGSQ